uniref:Uncharacterized protein n=1 Tax=Arundo donax TaxID=35708 RepID=A0A0A8Z493_ARUDO
MIPMRLASQNGSLREYLFGNSIG